MNDQKNTAGHLVVWSFIMTVLLPMNVLSANLIKELHNPNSITLQPHELFWRKSINDASSIYEFVNNSFDKAQGIANVDKGRLPSNEAFVFNEIRVGFTGGAAANATGKVKYNSAPSDELRNAEFEIIQGGRSVINLPVASLCNPHTGRNVQDDFTILGSLLYLRDEAEFTILLKFPSGVSIPAGGGASDNSYAEVRLRGYRTIRKG